MSNVYAALTKNIMVIPNVPQINIVKDSANITLSIEESWELATKLEDLCRRADPRSYCEQESANTHVVNRERYAR